ncbi:MAG TPA: IPT/TIG domain-containing protein [Acidobacteriaceae bacterium]|nr:IPT/TIG domain-containing protein [Acidobacteriaceae bacterium]
MTYTATPDPGWTFAGWTYDLTGTSNPASLTAKDESLVWANFNVTNVPLAITSLSPPSVAAGSSTFTLTINGTGFASNSVVIINGSTFPAVTFVNSTELQVQVDSSLVSSAGTFDVSVENFPVGSSGCAVFAYDTFAVTASGSGLITPTINWTPAAEIVRGDAGTKVLNATTTPPDIGGFTYSTSPGGDVTGGTSGLAPGTYTLTATFHPTDPQYTSTTASVTVKVAGETVWIVNGGGSLSELTGDGTAVSSSAYAGENGAAAIDSGGNVWSVGSGAMPLVETSQVGVVQNAISSGGGLNTPIGIAIDGASQIWVTNFNDSVSLFTNAGAALSPSGGFTDPSLSAPSGVAVDLTGSVWIANNGNNSVTRILGAAAPAAPLATAAQNNTTGAKP